MRCWTLWHARGGFSEWATVWTQSTVGITMLTIYAHTLTSTTWGPVTQGISVGWDDAGGHITVHSTDNVLKPNTWHHILVTYDGSIAAANRFTIYVDGIDRTDRSDVETGTIPDINPSAIEIGRDSSFYNDMYGGQIDDIRVYNRALSPDEIKRLYNMGR